MPQSRINSFDRHPMLRCIASGAAPTLSRLVVTSIDEEYRIEFKPQGLYYLRREEVFHLQEENIKIFCSVNSDSVPQILVA